jgi:cytochrome P450
MSQINTDRRCPVVDFEYLRPAVPALSLYQEIDELRGHARPAFWANEGEGYWVFTDHNVILDGLQRSDLWSSQIITPNDRDAMFKLIPVMVDPPEHAKWRQLLASWFSPKRVRAMKEEQERYAAELISSVKTAGACDFMREVAQTFPARVFINIMGMPAEMLDEFLRWEAQILHTAVGVEQQQAAQGKVVEYFAGLIAERRAAGDSNASDLVSAAVRWEVDGKPAEDVDILNCMLTLFLAGLDTVASQLGYSMLHLATHAADRERLVAQPDLIPHAVEELMRAYPILQTARKATRSEDFYGCPVKAGDVATFPLAAAGRDDAFYANASAVDFDRDDVRHVSFGAGPHRCLGSHLARQELAVVLTEWHRQIPDYELVSDPSEHGGGAWGLNALDLQWPLA